MGDSEKLTLGLRPVAEMLDSTLAQLAGERAAFVLVIGSGDGTVQYISNVARQDSMAVLVELLERWTEQESLGAPQHSSPLTGSKKQS